MLLFVCLAFWAMLCVCIFSKQPSRRETKNCSIWRLNWVLSSRPSMNPDWWPTRCPIITCLVFVIADTVYIYIYTERFVCWMIRERRSHWLCVRNVSSCATHHVQERRSMITSWVDLLPWSWTGTLLYAAWWGYAEWRVHLIVQVYVLRAELTYHRTIRWPNVH